MEDAATEVAAGVVAGAAAVSAAASGGARRQPQWIRTSCKQACQGSRTPLFRLVGVRLQGGRHGTQAAAAAAAAAAVSGQGSTILRGGC